MKDKRQAGTNSAKKKARKYGQSEEMERLLEQVDEWRSSLNVEDFQETADMRGCFFSNSDPCQESTDGIEFKYGFTNSEFIYWLAVIDPIEFIIVVTVFAIIFCEQFNLEELFVVVRFITSLRDGIDIIMNQRINLRLVCDIWNRQSDASEEEDENQLLKQELAALKRQYAQLHARLQGVEATQQATSASDFSEPTPDFNFGDGDLDGGNIESGGLAEDNLLAWTESLHL